MKKSYIAVIKVIAKITRVFHPRGIERILRLIHNPDRVEGIQDIIPYGGLKIQIDTSSFIEWVAFFKGIYEPEIIAVIKKYLPKGGAFVDVGANIGTHSLIASKIAGKVIAIEPVPEIAGRLMQNLEMNNIGNVDVLTCAVSDKAGTSEFYPSNTANKGLGSLCCRDCISGEPIEVDVKTLDDILMGERVDLIKIDTEGYDEHVILGAERTIKKWKPTIVCELSSVDNPCVPKNEIGRILERYKRAEIGRNILYY